MTTSPVSSWSCQDVRDWLVKENLGQYADTFADTHKMDGQTLLSLHEEDLRKPPLQIQVLADIKRLSTAIQELKTKHSKEKSGDLDGYSNDLYDRNSALEQDCEFYSINNNNRHKNGYISVELDDKITLLDIEESVKRPGMYAKRLDPEIFKTFVSFIYLTVVTLMVAFTIVVCHNRTPDRTKYPPLPDIILDNIPVIPWALAMCEIIAVALILAWIIVIFFHKHRFIIIRRLFSLMGTLYLLRVVSMLVTSLSVPGRQMQCREKYATWNEMMTGTLQIWSGVGMSIFGVMSCGDYMFSGHTTIITLLNFFVIEYTPSRMHYLHALSWIANLAGMFFLLAAHVHYSVDVFIAFYITSRLFLYYHTLANNRALMVRDEARRRFWFPLFSYFESKCDGIVPNDYEWPHLTKRLCAIVKYLRPNSVGNL